MVSMGDFRNLSVWALVTWKYSLCLVCGPFLGFFFKIRPLKWPSAKLVLANFKVSFCLLFSRDSKPKLAKALFYVVNSLEAQVL